MDERQAQDTPTEAKPGHDTAHAASELDGMGCCSDGVLGATDGGFYAYSAKHGKYSKSSYRSINVVELCQLVCTS